MWSLTRSVPWVRVLFGERVKFKNKKIKLFRRFLSSFYYLLTSRYLYFNASIKNLFYSKTQQSITNKFDAGVFHQPLCPIFLETSVAWVELCFIHKFPENAITLVQPGCPHITNGIMPKRCFSTFTTIIWQSADNRGNIEIMHKFNQVQKYICESHFEWHLVIPLKWHSK